jgi:hypothetical protein
MSGWTRWTQTIQVCPRYRLQRRSPRISDLDTIIVIVHNIFKRLHGPGPCRCSRPLVASPLSCPPPAAGFHRSAGIAIGRCSRVARSSSLPTISAVTLSAMTLRWSWTSGLRGVVPVRRWTAVRASGCRAGTQGTPVKAQHRRRAGHRRRIWHSQHCHLDALQIGPRSCASGRRDGQGGHHPLSARTQLAAYLLRSDRRAQ